MEWLFSWEVASWLIALFIGAAFAFLALSDFKRARLFFLLTAADAIGGIAMWGSKSDFPKWVSNALVIGLCGAVGYLLLLAMLYVESKEKVKSGNLVCEIESVRLEHFYRFFQYPPIAFQRLDTGIRISLTNGIGRPIYIRDYSVSALLGTEWVQFKNADRASFEPHAFGIMGLGPGKAYLARFNLSTNGFDYVMQQQPINPDENLILWMFFISGLSPKDQPGISQFKFSFRDSTGQELICVTKYSDREDRLTTVSPGRADISFLPFEPIPTNIKEEPPH